jgi:hypothetical protein
MHGYVFPRLGSVSVFSKLPVCLADGINDRLMSGTPICGLRPRPFMRGVLCTVSRCRTLPRAVQSRASQQVRRSCAALRCAVVIVLCKPQRVATERFAWQTFALQLLFRRLTSIGPSIVPSALSLRTFTFRLQLTEPAKGTDNRGELYKQPDTIFSRFRRVGLSSSFLGHQAKQHIRL